MQKWCNCKNHNSKDFPKVTNLYCNQFIPTGWKLSYKTLDDFEEGRYLYIIGICSVCGGKMKTGTSFPYNRDKTALAECIWQEFSRYRPFGNQLPEREKWYNEQDNLSSNQKVDEFISLFKKQDRKTISYWIQSTDLSLIS